MALGNVTMVLMKHTVTITMLALTTKSSVKHIHSQVKTRKICTQIKKIKLPIFSTPKCSRSTVELLILHTICVKNEYLESSPFFVHIIK